MTAEPRFVCDEMLGKLASWLRILGYDTTYLQHVEDAEVVATARREERVVLTRDVRLAERARDEPGSLLVRDRDPRAQVREVLVGLDLRVDPTRVLTRCTRCNARLEDVPAARVQEAVPPGVREHQDAFQRCPACGQIYWEGTHVDDIRAFLADLPGGRAIG